MGLMQLCIRTDLELTKQLLSEEHMCRFGNPGRQLILEMSQTYKYSKGLLKKQDIPKSHHFSEERLEELMPLRKSVSVKGILGHVFSPPLR